MAHFIGGIQGNRGAASRLGSKGSGIEAYAQGWHSGVHVYGHYNEREERDEFRVYANHGSYSGSGNLVALIYRDAEGNLVTEGVS